MCLLFNCTHSKCLLTQYTHVSVERASHKRVARSLSRHQILVSTWSHYFVQEVAKIKRKFIYLCSLLCYYGSVAFIFLDPTRPQPSWSLCVSLPQAFLSVNWAGQQTLPGLPNKATAVNLREDRENTGIIPRRCPVSFFPSTYRWALLKWCVILERVINGFTTEEGSLN